MVSKMYVCNRDDKDYSDIPGVSMNFLEKREVLKEASSEAVELAGKKMVQ